MALLTKGAIMGAFEEMLEEMAFDKITVSALVKRSGISPNTFYYHYCDKYALLNEWFGMKLRDIRKDEDDYAGLFLTGGRAPEYIRLNQKVISLVKCFMKSGKPVAAICHGAQVLAAADVLCGRTLTAYPAVGPDVKLAGGTYVEVAPDESVVDGNLVTSPAWPGNTAILRDFICLLEQQ